MAHMRTGRQHEPESLSPVRGWTGYKVLSKLPGEAKLGSTTTDGWLATPVLDLSHAGGFATVTFDMQRYGSDDPRHVQVLLSRDGTTNSFVQVGSDLSASDTMATFTVAITNGTASSIVRIATPARTNVST